MQRGQLTAVVWQDKWQVNILSTITDADSCSIVRRKEKDGTHTTVSCSNAIILYSHHMAGIDRGNQIRRYYNLHLKSTKYIFGFIVDGSIIYLE